MTKHFVFTFKRDVFSTQSLLQIPIYIKNKTIIIKHTHLD